MESKRQQKFARLIQKELAEVFQRDVSHLFNGKYVSVSTVRMTPDLGQARIHLSLLLVKDGQELLNEVQSNTKTIRHHLAQRIKNQARAIPELFFYLDDSAEYAAKMDKIIGDLHIPPAPADESEADAGEEDDLDGEDDEDEEDDR